MYLRRTKGPRAVALPEGGMMTRADLPPVETKRWVASRKALVVRAISCGLITRDEAVRLYALTDEEIDSWCAALARFGEKALLATRLKEFRI
jgi:hypothetical protein